MDLFPSSRFGDVGSDTNQTSPNGLWGGKGEDITERNYDPTHLDELMRSMLMQTKLADFPTNPKGNYEVKSIDPELMKTIFGTTWRVDRDDKLATVGIPDVPDTKAKKVDDSDIMEVVD